MGVKDCKEDKQMGTREIRSKRNLSENVKKRKIYFEHMMKKCGSLEKEPYRELCHRDRTRMSWLDNITEWTQSTFKRHSGIQRIENSGEGQSIMWSTLGSRKTEGKARRCHSSSLVSGRMRQTDWRRSTVVCMGRRLSVKLPPRLDCRCGAAAAAAAAVICSASRRCHSLQCSRRFKRMRWPSLGWPLSPARGQLMITATSFTAHEPRVIHGTQS